MFAAFSATSWSFRVKFLQLYVTILSTLNCQVAYNNL